MKDSKAKPSPQHQRLQSLRDALLDLHKTLMQSERIAYEAVFGTIPSSNHFLNLLIQDPWFAWLRSISALVAVMDEALENKEEPLTIAEGDRLTGQVRALLKASETGEGFSKHYYEALQRDPDVVLAHAGMVKLLSAPK